MNAQTIEKIKELKVASHSPEVSPLLLIQQLRVRMQELEEVASRKVFALNEISSIVGRKTKVV